MTIEKVDELYTELKTNFQLCDKLKIRTFDNLFVRFDDFHFELIEIPKLGFNKIIKIGRLTESELISKSECGVYMGKLDKFFNNSKFYYFPTKDVIFNYIDLEIESYKLKSIYIGQSEFLVKFINKLNDIFLLGLYFNKLKCLSYNHKYDLPEDIKLCIKYEDNKFNISRKCSYEWLDKYEYYKVKVFNFQYEIFKDERYYIWDENTILFISPYGIMQYLYKDFNEINVNNVPRALNEFNKLNYKLIEILSKEPNWLSK